MAGGLKILDGIQVILSKKADPSQYQHLLHAYTPARFKVGQMIGSFGILMGVVVAIYRNVDPDKKEKYKGMLLQLPLLHS